MKHTTILTLIKALLLTLLLLSVGLVSHIPGALAQGTQGDPPLTCRAEYPAARRVILTCGFGGRWDGTITIYNRQQQVDESRPWEQNVSQTDALWVFDARPQGQRRLDGHASLIIDFQPDGAGLRADLYDDQNGNGEVAYAVPVGDSEPQIRENPRSLPSIRVRTAENGWQRDNKVNYNLDIAIDGAIRGDFASDTRRYYEQFATDGTAKFTIEVRDNNQDGIADYEYRDSPILGNYIHTSLMVSNETRPTPLSNTLIWPYLAAKEWGFDQTYNQLKAPIQVNWKRSKIITVGEFVPSRGRPNNWFVYSIDRVAKGQNNLTNFESPFVFYNLSGIDDGFPDLQVRYEFYNPGELVRDFQEPIESVRYSWDMYHRQAWDYKVDLLGRHPITGTLQFNDFSIQGIPYPDVPSWALGPTYDQVNFVAYEGPGFFYSTEGIYEWGTQGEIRDQYITGQVTSYPVKQFEQIGARFRGEYRVAPQSTPRLYISSVDHKLHLFDAQGGLWNIDDRSKIHYADLKGDGFIDQWTYTRVIGDLQPITTTHQLDVSGSFLVFSNGREVRIRQASIEPALAWAAPPTNHAEWKDLGDTLKLYKRDFAPNELDAMMAQFEGPELRIRGSSLRNYRAVGTGGFRFVLTLSPGFQVEGAPLLDTSSLQPGEYVVSYDGSLAIAPLTPPAISGQMKAPITPHTLEAIALQVMLRNDGHEDMPEATLELWADPPQGQATLVATRTVTLLAQGPITTTLVWSPRLAGEWILTPQVRDPEDQRIVLKPVVVSVLPTRNPGLENLILLSTHYTILPLIILGLFFFAATAAQTFWRRWKEPQVKETDDTA